MSSSIMGISPSRSPILFLTKSYNQLAFITVCQLYGIDDHHMQAVLDDFSKPHFSYVRRLIQGKDISQQVVKFRTAIPASEFMKSAMGEGPAACVLIDQELDNNDIPGFVDLAWIYDMDFGPAFSNRITDIVLCGTHYRDFVIAFLAQGIDPEKIHYAEDTNQLSDVFLNLDADRIIIGYDLNGGHKEKTMIQYRLKLMFEGWEE